VSIDGQNGKLSAPGSGDSQSLSAEGGSGGVSAAATKGDDEIDIHGIMQMIPHRYPFLLVDRVLDIEPYKTAVGVKNVTINDQFFQGHFPTRPVMPGVLIIESMAQTSAVLVVRSLGEEAKGKLVFFMSIDSARFRKPVVPGDRLILHCETVRHRGNVWKFDGRAMVDEKLVAEATFAAMIMDN